MTDVILINPPITFKRLTTSEVRSDPLLHDQPPICYPPIGLGYLASVLENEGLSVRILNASLPDMDKDRLLRILGEECPRVIGITLLCFTLRSVYELIQDIKNINIDAEVVIGGIHVADDPKVVGKMGIRYGILGEGEFSFAKLCNYIVNAKGVVENIEGLIINNGEGFTINQVKVIKDLDTIPLPARHLLYPNKHYFTPADSRTMTVMITSRGCPFRCNYCHYYVTHIRKTFPHRRRSRENILSEMKDAVEKYGIRYIEFADGTFTVNRDYTIKLARTINHHRIQVPWGCETRADLIDEDLLKEMKAAGCKKIGFGVETGSDRTRFLLNKKVTNEHIEKAFKLCHSLGIETKANILFGVPSETIEELKDTICFTKNLNPTYAEFHTSLLMPNIYFYEYALKEGLISEDLFDRFMYGETKFPRFVPPGLTTEILDKIERKAHRQFYFRPTYILERVKSLRNIKDLKNNVRVGLWLARNFLFNR